jgi:hypothetical protein
VNSKDIQLKENILNTVIYYDVLNYPLTAFEFWQYLTVPGGDATEKGKCSLGDIIEVLDSEEIKKHIEEFRGFYFLKGRKNWAVKRIQNDKNSIAKFKIAEKVAWWLRFVPFVRIIAVTGTLAMKNPKIGSDIDFFVVLEKGRIFTGRLLVTVIVHLLGTRRYGKKIKNRICLNYFITTGSLEIERQDVFGANEYSFVYPIFGFDFFQKFCETNAGWIKEFKPNWETLEIKPAKYYTEHSKVSRLIQKTKESLINFLGGDIIEAWLRKKQIARIERNPLTKKEGSYVEATGKNLIFLPEPQGEKIYEEYKKKSKEMFSSGVIYDESFG